MTEARLRGLTGADLDRIAELEVELFGAGAWSRETLLAEFAAPGRWYVGADVDGGLAGYAGLWFDGVDAQVMTIGVAADRQRGGVGRALLHALLDAARDLGAVRMLLEVRVDNDVAIALYTDAGFERLGLRRGYYQPEGIDALTMQLDLRGRPGTRDLRGHGAT